MSIMQTLRESKLFAGVGEEHLQALVPAFRRIDVEKESIVLKEGEPARYVYLVEEGRVILHVNLERPDGSSTGPTTFASITPGEAFGWSALVEPRLNTLSASAAERSSLIRVEEAALREMFSSDPAMGYVVMSNIAEILTERLTGAREALVYHRSWVEYQQTLAEGAS